MTIGSYHSGVKVAHVVQSQELVIIIQSLKKSSGDIILFIWLNIIQIGMWEH